MPGEFKLDTGLLDTCLNQLVPYKNGNYEPTSFSGRFRNAWLSEGEKQQRKELATELHTQISKITSLLGDEKYDEAKKEVKTCRDRILEAINSDYSKGEFRELLDDTYFALKKIPNNTKVMIIHYAGTEVAANHPRSASAEVTRKFENVLHLDGVGTQHNNNIYKDTEIEPKGKKHKTPGLFDPHSYTKAPKKGVPSFAEKGPLAKAFAKTFGFVFGSGGDNNEDYVINHLRHLKECGRLPEVIIFDAYSRGVPKSNKLKARIAKEFPKIKFQSIYDDPAKGPIDFFASPIRYLSSLVTSKPVDEDILHPNDRNVYIFRAINETSSMFPAQTLYKPNDSGTKYVQLPLPGTHTNQDLQRHSEETASTAYQVKQALTERILLQHGAKMKEGQKENETDDYQLLELFAKGVEEYKKKAGRKAIKKALNSNSNYNGFFLNEMHRVLFAELFPSVYKVFFEGKEVPDTTEINKELGEMKKEAGGTFEQFKNVVTADTELNNKIKVDNEGNLTMQFKFAANAQSRTSSSAESQSPNLVDLVRRKPKTESAPQQKLADLTSLKTIGKFIIGSAKLAFKGLSLVAGFTNTIANKQKQLLPASVKSSESNSEVKKLSTTTSNLLRFGVTAKQLQENLEANKNNGSTEVVAPDTGTSTELLSTTPSSTLHSSMRFGGLQKQKYDSSGQDSFIKVTL